MHHDASSLNPALMLALNNAYAKETSELDLSGMKTLLDMACYARGIDHGASAFLIALDQNARYVNQNFTWFQTMYESFLYVDRVIVAESARGRGIAKRLYEDLFRFALHAGHPRVVCEVNIEPPNHASLVFHTNMGFEEVGQATISNGTKTVRYFAKTLQGSPTSV